MIADHDAPHYAFLPVTCSFVPVRPIYLPQHPVLGYKDEGGNPKSDTLRGIEGYPQNCRKITALATRITLSGHVIGDHTYRLQVDGLQY